MCFYFNLLTSVHIKIHTNLALLHGKLQTKQKNIFFVMKVFLIKYVIFFLPSIEVCFLMYL